MSVYRWSLDRKQLLHFIGQIIFLPAGKEDGICTVINNREGYVMVDGPVQMKALLLPVLRQ